MSANGQLHGMLVLVEKVLTTLVWIGMALYVVGLLPDVLQWLEAVRFPVGGKHPISIADALLGVIWILLTVLVIAVSKFFEGAWITVIVIPSLVLLFLRIRAHFHEVGRELTMTGLPPSLRPYPPARVVIPISSVHRGTVEAMDFAQSISSDVTGVYVGFEPGEADDLREPWERLWPDIPLVVVPSPYRSLIEPLIQFLDETDLQRHDGQLATLLLPEFVPAHWWQSLLHNQTAWMLKAALLYRRRKQGFQRVIIDVPFHLKK